MATADYVERSVEQSTSSLPFVASPRAKSSPGLSPSGPQSGLGPAKPVPAARLELAPGRRGEVRLLDGAGNLILRWPPRGAPAVAAARPGREFHGFEIRGVRGAATPARPVDSVMDRIEAMVAWFRQRRWAHLAVVNLRILIGFAFLPAGLKKILGEPFTDPGNRGPFHEFLHAFHATGHFYTFVGVVQLVAATLLMTQRFATAGAFMALPVTGAILAFCWSTAVVPTAMVVTLMFAGLVGLALWDVERWRGVLDAPDATPRAARASSPAPIDLRLWSLCGAAILVAYLATCLLSGGIYRPRGPAFDEPGFYRADGAAAVPDRDRAHRSSPARGALTVPQ